jgi:hypothetical protein
MITELVLDEYNEDPVNLVIVRLAEHNVNKTCAEDPGEDVYVVEHIIEARGSQHVKASMTIQVPARDQEAT